MDRFETPALPVFSTTVATPHYISSRLTSGRREDHKKPIESEGLGKDSELKRTLALLEERISVRTRTSDLDQDQVSKKLHIHAH